MAPLSRRERPRTVILGAGIAGRLVLEELRRHKRLGYVPVGFLDDDARKHRRRIGGLPVWGRLESLPAAARKHDLHLALFAIPSASGELHLRVARLARAAGLELRIVPGFYEVLERDTAPGRIRPVTLEDFFRRPPIPFDLDAMRQALTGKSVLITGAAGSIGRELCRQLAAFEPRELLLVDHEENNLYDAYLHLREAHPSVPMRALIADIRDRVRIRSILRTYQPDVVYHAAAYKHVPIMELSVLEAIKTNILGTAVLVEEAAKQHIRRFVLISTDKAVNPSSIMGTCKRVAEQIVQSAARRFPSTAFMLVRFGNVVPSRGNVIERFSEQIAKGGPVTITHPAMKRYFMTCEEAAQLVMQASAWGRGGETFVLDLGHQMKMTDVAKEMIRLAGLEPGRDIQIVYTGVRPGEKFAEELLTKSERASQTRHQRIRVVIGAAKPWREIVTALRALTRAVATEDQARGRQLLHHYVPSYREPGDAVRTASHRRRTAR